eukprot:1158398-Pelagomonas_calceolata.AAC.6
MRGRALVRGRASHKGGCGRAHMPMRDPLDNTYGGPVLLWKNLLAEVCVNCPLDQDLHTHHGLPRHTPAEVLLSHQGAVVRSQPDV